MQFSLALNSRPSCLCLYQADNQAYKESFRLMGDPAQKTKWAVPIVASWPSHMRTVTCLTAAFPSFLTTTALILTRPTVS